MYCSACGKPIENGSRFCSACGASVAEAGWSTTGSGGANGSPFRVPPRLLRLRSPRLIAGVCSGLARYYGWNLELVRILTVLICLVFGTGVLIYLICWLVIPEEPVALPVQGR